MKRVFATALLGVNFLLATTITLPYLSEEILLEGFNNGNILEIPAGITLPLSFGSDCLHLNGTREELSVTFDQKFFIRFEENDLLFSQDLLSWKPMSTFFTGSLGLMTSDIPNELSLNLQIYKRLE